ncbi:MAG TPA: hypothetical protein VMW64_07080 [Dehalococcoidia bacterium]|nr:hypothetical protein [Dehalococcoidia bacterium]
MLKIGRYGIDFGLTFWFQTRVPTRVRHFLCFWFIKEARPTDHDKTPQFPFWTPMEHEGRKYRYCKAGEDIVVNDLVKENE